MTQKSPTQLAELLNEAEAAEMRGDWTIASDRYRHAIALAPLDAHVWYRAGTSLFEAAKPEESLQFLEKASMLAPGTVEFDLKLGDVFFSLRQFGEAIETYKKVLAEDANNVSATNNIGISLQEAGELKDAINALNHTLLLAPDDPIVMANYAAALLKADRSEEALPLLIRATNLNPNSAKAWSNLAIAYEASLRLEEALKAHGEAILLEPDNASLHYNQAMSFLLRGEYDEGFQSFEYRRLIPDRKPREFDIPEWLGESLSGKRILVHAEQGAGDTIQFARFLPQLECLGAKITFSVHQSLYRLGPCFSGNSSIISTRPSEVDFDFQIPLLSLPCRLGLTLNDISVDGPYISLPTNGEIRPAKNLRIGIVWAGNPNHANDANRSIAFPVFQSLFSVPDIEWVSLQYGERASDLNKCPFAVEDKTTECRDFADTALAIQNLDLVISVDTSVAHLAGAMGTPVWILLPYLPDWRWLLDRRDSPWYRTAKLFRQASPNNWSLVISEVQQALRKIKTPLQFRS
tara:strand:- start:522 stop:2081 length:1560 start_codon:yes stop_codon:yes gene_type:complete